VPLIVSGINEVTCRGGQALAIGQEDSRLRSNASELIVLPKSTPQIASLLAVLPLQMLSYHVALARGYDPDFPRNLSKTLTVD
jgi:glucosamine--fructose-6-phosphate aminotransferase (isomerizing)